METYDLKDGYVLSTKDDNSWQTFIESVLVRNGTDEAFLTTECRVEFMDGKHPIFGHRYADIRVIKGWDADYFLRLGAGIHHPFRPAVSRELHLGDVTGMVGVEVVSRKRLVRVWSVEEIHRALRAGTADNWFFMRLNYRVDGADYEMICPCRYTNFSTPARQGHDYVQPISGPVLFADAKGYHVAYVAAHLRLDGNVVAEAIKCVPTYVLDAKLGVGGRAVRLLRALFSPVRGWFLIDEFTDVVELDAAVEIFSYA